MNQLPAAEVNDLTAEFGFKVAHAIRFLRAADAHKIKISKLVGDGKV